MEADAVFEGGGVKGIAFVGAIEVMESRGYTWNKLAGTFIPTGKVTTTKFELTEEDKHFLLSSGHAAADKFLETWDFEDYKHKFRENHAAIPVQPFSGESQQESGIYH